MAAKVEITKELLNYIPYDLETYPNIFTFCSYEEEFDTYYVFEISDRKDEREKLFAYLRTIYRRGKSMLGFNNEGFDYSVLHYILNNKRCSVASIYKKAMSIINDHSDQARFKHTVREQERMLPQVDLYKIHHFDNKARATSLKLLEFNMRSPNISDLPYPVGEKLKHDEKDVLIAYNKHDVSETWSFAKHSIKAVAFREVMSERFGRNFMNFNDVKIGKEYFIDRLESNVAGCCYDTSTGKRKVRQTKRKKINLGECVLPYVKFNSPEFNSILNWLNGTTITETKESLNDLLEKDLGDVAKYAKMVTKSKKLKLGKGEEPSDELIAELKKEDPTSYIDRRELKSGGCSYWNTWRIADNLNVVVGGFQFDFGTGGIHGSVESQSIYSDDDYLIIDVDVASYYPNLSIQNMLYPEHLGEEFCKVYQDVYNERKSHKKGTVENAMMKLALNGVYGASNDKFAPFFDPKFTMSITINGQLLLCMLSEKLLEIDDLTVIQINTDGVTFRTPRKHVDKCMEICKDWEELTKLELERADYSSMHIRDVNNYIAVYENGDVKRKGAYEYEDLDWSKNHSSLVIRKAASHVLLDGGDVESFIKNHKDIMDFMLRVKVPRSSRVESIDEWGNRESEQNICRYYISNEGVNLFKIMPPIEVTDKNRKFTTILKDPETGETEQADTEAKIKRFKKKGFTEVVDVVEVVPTEREFKICDGWKVQVCNDMSNFNSMSDINYDYYIEEANKLVEEVRLIKM